MRAEDVQKLVLWLSIALSINFLAGLTSAYFSQFLLSSISDPSPEMLISAESIQYINYLKAATHLAVNLIIAFWLYKVTSSKKYFWGLLGVVAKWWALALFVLYDYLLKHEDSKTQ